MAGLRVKTEPTPSNGGQWGLAQDDYGKLWWSNGGAEIPLYHFQVPILYGAFDLPAQMPRRISVKCGRPQGWAMRRAGRIVFARRTVR